MLTPDEAAVISILRTYQLSPEQKARVMVLVEKVYRPGMDARTLEELVTALLYNPLHLSTNVGAGHPEATWRQVLAIQSHGFAATVAPDGRICAVMAGTDANGGPLYEVSFLPPTWLAVRRWLGY